MSDPERFATVHDVLTVGNRMWIVSGVFLGGLGVESLVELQSYDIADGHIYGKDCSKYIVPEAIIRAAIESGAIILHPAKGAAL